MNLELFKDLHHLTPFETSWRSPANIAFVKYWGKKGHQLPANPSLSMTLKECVTETKTSFSPGDALAVELFFEGERSESFGNKIQSYLASLTSELPWLSKLHVRIETKNSFPHGTGIASSASGLSAFALCLTDYLHHLRPAQDPELFETQASYLARLMSGSACRSIYGGYVTWGESTLPQSSDKFATPLKVHSELENLLDTVVVVSEKEKQVSSREGHSRLKDHSFAEARFSQAKKNFIDCVDAMKAGDMDRVGLILENEALSLHAMMMTSPESYTLLKPNSLTVMEMVRAFRRETKLPLYFTLDAGPNLHLIYPDSVKNKIQTFVTTELAPYAVKIIDDQRGEGPKKC